MPIRISQDSLSRYTKLKNLLENDNLHPSILEDIEHVYDIQLLDGDGRILYKQVNLLEILAFSGKFHLIKSRLSSQINAKLIKQHSYKSILLAAASGNLDMLKYLESYLTNDEKIELKKNSSEMTHLITENRQLRAYSDEEPIPHNHRSGQIKRAIGLRVIQPHEVPNAGHSVRSNTQLNTLLPLIASYGLYENNPLMMTPLVGWLLHQEFVGQPIPEALSSLPMQSVWNSLSTSFQTLMEKGHQALTGAKKSYQSLLESMQAVGVSKRTVPFIETTSQDTPSQQDISLIRNTVINNLPNALVAFLYVWGLKKAHKKSLPLSEQGLKQKKRVLNEKYQLIALIHKQKEFEFYSCEALRLSYYLLNALNTDIFQKLLEVSIEERNQFIENLKNQIQYLIRVHKPLCALAQQLPHYQKEREQLIEKQRILEALYTALCSASSMQYIYSALIEFIQQYTRVHNGTSLLDQPRPSKKKTEKLLKQQEKIAEIQRKEARADLRSADFTCQDFEKSVQEYLNGELASHEVEDNFKVSTDILHTLCSQQNIAIHATTPGKEEFRKQDFLIPKYSLFNSTSYFNRTNLDLLTNNWHRVIYT